MLTQGGIPSWLASAHDPKFDAFLDETRQHLASGSFERVLEVCLDSAMDMLSRGVDKHVFGSHGEDDAMMGQEPRERLAAMLPGLARWCHLALESLPNELVDVRSLPSVLAKTSLMLRSSTCRPWQTSGRFRHSQLLFIQATTIAFGNPSALFHIDCTPRSITGDTPPRWP